MKNKQYCKVLKTKTNSHREITPIYTIAWLGRCTSIKDDRVKLVLRAKASTLSEMMDAVMQVFSTCE